jgi:hypothetical protein
MPHDALLDLEVTDAEYAEFGRARVALHGLKHLTAPDGGASNHSEDLGHCRDASSTGQTYSTLWRASGSGVPGVTHWTVSRPSMSLLLWAII